MKKLLQNIFEKAALTRLEKLELISSYRGKKSNGSPRTYYKITRSGEQYYLNKKQEWLEMVEIMNDFLGGIMDG